MMKNKPKGATHLEDEKPDVIEEVIGEDDAAQFAIAAAIPDPASPTPSHPRYGSPGKRRGEIDA